MKCSVCGSENLEGSAYCEDCGARLPQGIPAVTQEAPAVPLAAPASFPAPVAESVPSPAPAPAPAPMPQPAPQAPVPDVQPVSGTIRCVACGAENPSSESYCEDCGASLTAARAEVETPSPVAAVPVAIEAAAPAASPRPRLSLVDGGGEFLLDRDVMALGRRSPADSIFPEIDLTEADTESYISRRHGRIVRQEGRILYEDVGSSNGSFLNGNRLTAGVQAEIHEGDRLRLGKTEMVYLV
ncbi:MAG: FHA domain-containing protein [Candidatus Xenobium sp.]|jgi:hypothetical protein|nr:FHA domain-containing protein [Burkholderiales bacterium]